MSPGITRAAARMASCVLIGFLQPAMAPAQAREAGAPSDVAGAELVTVMFEDFATGATSWRTEKLDRRESSYALVPSGADSALEGVSRNAAAGFIRMVEAPPTARGVVSWRWRTAASLTANSNERAREGDDYVARVFLTFGGDPFTRGTRALAYAWAGQEPVGAVFVNPYVDDVMTIVLRSGNADAGGWVQERRDFVADFTAAFGEPPPPLTAIAVLVDSDDTGSSAVARFDDFRIEVAP
jgi:hypothetical protein